MVSDYAAPQATATGTPTISHPESLTKTNLQTAAGSSSAFTGSNPPTTPPGSSTASSSQSSNSPPPSDTASNPTAAPTSSPKSCIGVSAALGTVLGVIVIASALIIVFLWRRNRCLVRAAHHADETAALGRASSVHPVHNQACMAEEESAEKLRKQLSQVRSELAAVAVLAPSTVRDQTDYIRDLNLLNDSIRQISMRINRTRPQPTAAVIRTALYSTLQSTVFDKFDAGLDTSTEERMSFIMSKFDKPSTAVLWKAMTVKVLPLASPESIATLVKRSSPILSGILSGNNAPAKDIIDIVQQALKLSRAIAEDGKGFSVSYREGVSIPVGLFHTEIEKATNASP